MKTEEFIEKANKVHNNFYSYGKTDLNNRDDKGRVIVTCPIHGDFLVNVSSHLKGTKCKKCAKKISAAKKTLSIDEFIKKAKQVHGDRYDYSKTEYKTSKEKVCIICPEHGEFWQTPLNHLNGAGCKKCSYINKGNKLRSSNEEFIKKAKQVHGDKYDYSKVKYKGSFEKVCIICPEHGEFWQRPVDHLNGRGCQRCRESKLEKIVCDALIKNSINFERQKKFNWLGRQSLDFYLPDYNIAIECQGEQHYKKRDKIFFENYSKIINRDIKKYNKCINNDVNVIYFAGVDKIDNISIYTKNNLFSNIEKIINFLNE